MPTPLSDSSHRARRARWLVAGGVLLAATATTTAVATGPAGASGGARTPVSDVRLVQANIYTGLTVPKFQADVATVLAQQPDFVTYNEVMFRHDGVLAPAGYDIYRSMRNRFTAENPVIWRSDRWTAIDEGTYRISNWRGVPPGKEVELGRRFANWVTLKGTDGRVLSVVSIHVAPLTRGMPDLLRRSVRHLSVLVSDLAPRGPVLVGGDFNVHYKSGRYPRDLLTAAGLVPTYDTMGAYFPTGDHHGMTIDYVFDHGTETLLADNQYPVELNSDHDAVVAGFTWQVDLPSQSRVVTNDPNGDATSQRAAVTAVVHGIKAAEPGSVVAVATTRLGLPRIARQLKRAADRGVRVHVVVAGDRATAAERRISRHLAALGDAHNWLERCVSSCLRTYDDAGVPRGFLMISGPDRVWQSRYDSNRRFSRALVQESARVRISTGEVALRDGAAMFRQIS
jgi:endonuclease/exonuclease/phosphatase family metal-dependent hydrolase